MVSRKEADCKGGTEKTTSSEPYRSGKEVRSGGTSLAEKRQELVERRSSEKKEALRIGRNRIVFELLFVALICSCEEEAVEGGTGALTDGGSRIYDTGTKPMDAEPTPRDAQESGEDSANALIDGEASREDDENVGVECVPGSIFEGDPGDGVYRIRSMSDLARLEGYEKVGADLFIPWDPREESNINSLSCLICLTSIPQGRIGPLKDLEDLEGLEGLTSVAWSMGIGGNEKLTNIDGLVNLESIGEMAEISGDDPATGSLWIKDNDSLLDLEGLASLVHLYGYLIVENNKSLPTCEAIELKERLERAGWTGEATICGNLRDECGSDPCPNE